MVGPAKIKLPRFYRTRVRPVTPKARANPPISNRIDNESVYQLNRGRARRSASTAIRY